MNIQKIITRVAYLNYDALRDVDDLLDKNGWRAFTVGYNVRLYKHELYGNLNVQITGTNKISWLVILNGEKIGSGLIWRSNSNAAKEVEKFLVKKDFS